MFMKMLTMPIICYSSNCLTWIVPSLPSLPKSLISHSPPQNQLLRRLMLWRLLRAELAVRAHHLEAVVQVDGVLTLLTLLLLQLLQPLQLSGIMRMGEQ
jgi:hypothetical protein